MVNSIKDKLEEADTVSEIRLLLVHSKDYVCVIVEGDYDQVIFKPLLSEHVHLLQSYASTTGVDKLIKEHFPHQKRVIGIKDKDYSKRSVSKRCFFCDYCNMEMMIIAIDSCNSRLFCNFYKGTTFDSNSLRMHCLEHLEFLSKLRMQNELKSWRVRFCSVNVGRIYDENISNMERNLITSLNNANPQNIIDTKREALCRKIARCESLEDYLMITNGHDYVRIFFHICHASNDTISLASVQSALRASFGPSEFKETELYKVLHEYQSKHNLSIVC